MTKQEKTEIEGIVVDRERNVAIVETEFGTFNCTFGRLRKKFVKIVEGDRVLIKVGLSGSELDTNAVISRRL